MGDVKKEMNQKDVGLCFLCKNLGVDESSCTKEYLFLVDKRTCIAFDPSE